MVCPFLFYFPLLEDLDLGNGANQHYILFFFLIRISLPFFLFLFFFDLVLFDALTSFSTGTMAMRMPTRSEMSGQAGRRRSSGTRHLTPLLCFVYFFSPRYCRVSFACARLRQQVWLVKYLCSPLEDVYLSAWVYYPN